MCDEELGLSAAFRQDFPAYNLSTDNLVSFKKTSAPYFRAAKNHSKPDRCLICGEEMPKFCLSHTVPQFCLRAIAVDGKLLTSSAVVGGNIVEDKVGIGKAATFKQVCRRCDSEFFKLYETPETLLTYPSSQVLGQIAAKNLLREVSKARQDIGLKTALGDGVPPMIRAIADVRTIDAAEDEKAFKTALRIGKNPKSSNAFHVVFYTVLPYTAPFVFQQMISPLADFTGNVINYSYNLNPKYRIEPLHVCVLPTKGCTVVLLFRSEKAKRYREFERQFNALSEAEKLQSIVKLVFAYSEDVLISPGIGAGVLKDENLISLARMNSIYLGFGESSDDYKRTTATAAMQDYAIDNLPNPPELLSREYALATSAF